MTFEESIFLAAPAFFLLIGLEVIVAKWQKKNVYSNLPDAISSISSGLANGTTAVLGIGISLVSYSWLREHFALFQIDSHTPLTWFLVIVGLDFAGYWGHRFTHKYNFLWQMHVVHHSSEEFNLPCALRQTVSGQLLKVFTILGLPLAILGVPIEIIGVVSLVHLYYQYWYHTQLIGNLGWLERILVTPEQHAIHHAINPEYIDKNFGQWFSIWDQIFGSFQPRIKGVEPVFGVTTPVHTWNPIKIDFMVWIQMLKDLFHTDSLAHKLRVFISPPGWRPEDAEKIDPVEKISDVFNFEKYKPPVDTQVLRLCATDFFLTLFLQMFFFYKFTSLSHTEALLFGGFILLSIASYTTVMEGRRAMGLLSSRLGAFVLLLIYWGGDWFGLNALAAGFSFALAAFYAGSIAISYYLNAPSRSLNDLDQLVPLKQ